MLKPVINLLFFSHGFSASNTFFFGFSASRKAAHILNIALEYILKKKDQYDFWAFFNNDGNFQMIQQKIHDL